MFTAHKFKILISLLVISSISIFFVSKYTQEPHLDNISQVLGEQYKNQYTTKTAEIDGLLVSVAHSTTSPNSGTESDKYDDQASPLIIIQDRNTQEIVSRYEITFDREEEEDYSTGNIIFAQSIDFKNIDKDPQKEVVTIWGINWGGSGGYLGLVILDKRGNDFIPISGLPGVESKNGKFVLTEKIKSSKFEFATTELSNYLEVIDLNGDKLSDILHASYIWGDNEAHFEDHFWNLEVYEIGEKSQKIPSWWNNGKSFTTIQEIGFDEDAKLDLLETFQNKVN